MVHCDINVYLWISLRTEGLTALPVLVVLSRDVVVGAVFRDTEKTATMADISLYLTNVNVSIGQNLAVEQVGKQLSLLFSPHFLVTF